MCKEIYHVIQTMDQEDVEFQLALQCAPVITGIKISNLLMIAGEHARAVIDLLKDSDISWFCLRLDEKKTAFLLYRQEELVRYLQRPKVQQILACLGYEDFSLKGILRKFRKHYVAHMNKGMQFPHEMGLLLGYPVEDVVGFMNHSGKNYLYSGYWKVYANVSEKKRIFAQYDEARETLVRILANDIGIRLILEIYCRDRMKEIAV